MPPFVLRRSINLFSPKPKKFFKKKEHKQTKLTIIRKIKIKRRAKTLYESHVTFLKFHINLHTQTYTDKSAWFKCVLFENNLNTSELYVKRASKVTIDFKSVSKTWKRFLAFKVKKKELNAHTRIHIYAHRSTQQL